MRDAHASVPERAVRAKGEFTHWDGKKASANRTGNEACSVICFFIFYILFYRYLFSFLDNKNENTIITLMIKNKLE